MSESIHPPKKEKPLIPRADFLEAAFLAQRNLSELNMWPWGAESSLKEPRLGGKGKVLEVEIVGLDHCRSERPSHFQTCREWVKENEVSL
ncbi:hypothetical protein J0A67_05175 [Algoriphagus aestuariicola]|uniref:Uncharacterized protein n=1 Tax=Algoriphagus aestuariicola TaxID=1852016 RepID=A0ABS3BPQ4_9BACT|nr:hypothetical protein [Algoriphagus aestuariicola]MBN7800241.1 hypothetical protein [Algoriphagus aestuariicola]